MTKWIGEAAEFKLRHADASRDRVASPKPMTIVEHTPQGDRTTVTVPSVQTVECPKSADGDHRYNQEKGASGATVYVCAACGHRAMKR